MTLIFILIRCLNNQLVKKRQRNDGSNMMFEYSIEFNEPPLVEIGEVKDFSHKKKPIY